MGCFILCEHSFCFHCSLLKDTMTYSVQALIHRVSFTMSFSLISCIEDGMFLLDLYIGVRVLSARVPAHAPRRFAIQALRLGVPRESAQKNKSHPHFSGRRHQFYAPAPFTPSATTWVALLFPESAWRKMVVRLGLAARSATIFWLAGEGILLHVNPLDTSRRDASPLCALFPHLLRIPYATSLLHLEPGDWLLEAGAIQ